MPEAAEKVTPIRPPTQIEENVWTALAKAQAEFPPLGKSATGARPSEKYAPLDEALDALRPILNKHGLTPTSSSFIADGQMTLKRKLVHGASGTATEIDWPVCPITKTPREIGSASTYARRYSLLAICEVHPCNEDDDGQHGSNPAPKAQTRAQEKQDGEGDKAAERMRAWLLSKHGLLKACETPKEVHATWKVVEDSPKWPQIMAAIPTDAIGLRTYKDNLLKNWSAGEALADEIPF